MTQTFLIGSPLSGWVLPLASIPDPVFAQGMAGDGVAIDPTSSVLHAPCDGTVHCHPRTPHALSLRTDGGVELLMHIGIDSVLLKGRGFKVLVTDGGAVTSGQPLIEFDLDLIVDRAASAITPILLASSNARIISRCENRAVAAGDTLFELERTGTDGNVSGPSGNALEQAIRVAFDQGMHARPAAAFAAVLRAFNVAATVTLQGRSANALSMVAVMSLGIKQGDRIELSVFGPEAGAAMEAALAFFANEALHHGAGQEKRPVAVPAKPVNGVLQAVIASRGFAVGKAYPLKPQAFDVREQGSGVDRELSSLRVALDKLKAHLIAQRDESTDQHQDIVSAHIELVQDPVLNEHSERLVGQGKSAAFAWMQASAEVVTALLAMDNEYMKARIADFRDIEQNMLKALFGMDLSAKRALPEQCILIIDELLPSQLMSLDSRRISGICSSGGGPSAHAAIIAASMGIPFLVAAGPDVHGIAEGNMLILDAESGCLHLDVDASDWQAAMDRLERERARTSAERASALLPAVTQDGSTVHVFANLGGASEADNAMAMGAQGCGLLRTEFLFMDRQNAPTEEEQYRVYGDIALRMPDMPLTIRTMDIGGDKPIAYLPLPKEENPALGLRGLRTSLWRDQLFIDQLRAMLRLPQPNQLRILLPMVNDLGDVESARRYIDQCAKELALTSLPAVGIMIETPASALLVDQLLEKVDFVSIGSNDLSQYVLAIDRGHPELASKLDALHPAVLRLIKQVAEKCRSAGKKVSLCGGLASEPAAVPLLLGMDVLELSVVPALIPRIKRLIRQLHMPACRELATQALQQADAASVRRIASEFILKAEQGEPT